MVKNPDGSIPFSKAFYSNRNVNKLVSLVNKQSADLSIKDEEKRRTELKSIEKDFLELYKKLIIGTSVETSVIQETNNKCLEMCRNRNRKVEYISRESYEEEKDKIDVTLYNKLKSSGFGKSDNIVRCELEREEEFEEVTAQKLALWSDKLAHITEENSLRYMQDLGYNQNLKKMDDEDRQKIEKTYLGRLRKAYIRFSDEDNYKFNMNDAFNQLVSDDFDLATNINQNICNLQKLMIDSGFSRSSSSKASMKSFLYCLRDQRYTDYFYGAKTNFSKDLLLQIEEQKGDSTLDAYAVKDYAVKDNKGRDTIRLVVGNLSELDQLSKSNDCVYMNDSWKNSLKFEYADEILSKLGKDASELKINSEVDNIANKIASKGTKMNWVERDASIARASSLIIHVPEDEMNGWCQKNGFNLRNAKTLTEKSFAFGGNSLVDVGFGARDNEKTYDELPRYNVLKKLSQKVERRNTSIEKAKLSKKKGE